MYFLLDARNDGEKAIAGTYKTLVDDFESARRYAETNGVSDELYDCYMLKTNLSDSSYWLLKRSKGGWDFYYDFGRPLIVNTMGVNQSWDDFSCDADEDELAKAKSVARNGTYQAIYDAYQSLFSQSPSQCGLDDYSFRQNAMRYAAGCDFDNSDFGLGSFGLDSDHGDYSDPF